MPDLSAKDLLSRAKPVSRDDLERVAHIVGPFSAARAALNEADEYAGDVCFYRLGDHIILERIPAETVNG